MSVGSTELLGKIVGSTELVGKSVGSTEPGRPEVAL